MMTEALMENSLRTEDSSNINSTPSEIDYEGRIGMTINANSRDNHNNDVDDDISDYNDYQGGNNSVNCSDNEMGGTLQKLVSNRGTGNLSKLCTVLPPDINVEAMPLHAPLDSFSFVDVRSAY
ncbi:Hypothetical predicted protein [Octopus vulgaris]|uniref:Uncharacterized protein n=1 Tax=Octopus vulgaris TaxID=6645 RepID=A0AA36FMN4_OCTVU|nr:Hypothetical predicted protein [Octopus vulgaris]